MGKIISFANQKGGVGKTTSAVNIAASLGVLGYNTLLVDLDPQGNATSGVGIAKKNLQYTIKDVLMGKIVAQEAIIKTEFQKLSLIPSNMSLAGTEFDLLQDDSPEPWAAILSTRFSVVMNQGNLNSETGLPLSVFQIRDHHQKGPFGSIPFTASSITLSGFLAIISRNVVSFIPPT